MTKIDRYSPLLSAILFLVFFALAGTVGDWIRLIDPNMPVVYVCLAICVEETIGASIIFTASSGARKGWFYSILTFLLLYPFSVLIWGWSLLT